MAKEFNSQQCSSFCQSLTDMLCSTRGFIRGVSISAFPKKTEFPLPYV